jgi:hypothetical protein
MRRSVSLFVALVVLLAATGGRTTPSPPALEFEAGVPSDVAALAERAWSGFLASIPARHECLGDLRLETDRDLAERGRYEPDRRVVTLRIPHTAPRLERTLMHEFAHHLEFSCPEQTRLRATFSGLQENSPDTTWFGGSTASDRPSRRWASIPSEQWAETVTEIVLGPGSADPTITVNSEAKTLVDHWMRGETPDAAHAPVASPP